MKQLKLVDDKAQILRHAGQWQVVESPAVMALKLCTTITTGYTTHNNSSEKGCLLLWLWARCLPKQSLLHLHQKKGNGLVLSP
jgi:hypothetical protein